MVRGDFIVCESMRRPVSGLKVKKKNRDMRMKGDCLVSESMHRPVREKKARKFIPSLLACQCGAMS